MMNGFIRIGFGLLLVGLGFSCRNDQQQAEPVPEAEGVQDERFEKAAQEPISETAEDAKGEGNPGIDSGSRAQDSSSQELKNLIQISTPDAGERIISPLRIAGRARGSWFFEGDFAIYLYDGQGRELAVAIAQAQGDWMTEDLVPFRGVMEFSAPETRKGFLVFEKSNPSDRRDLDRELRMEVRF